MSQSNPLSAANEEDWVKEFDEKFPGATSISGHDFDIGWSLNHDSSDIKMFFRSVLAVKLSERYEAGIQAERAKLSEWVKTLGEEAGKVFGLIPKKDAKECSPEFINAVYQLLGCIEQQEAVSLEAPQDGFIVTQVKDEKAVVKRYKKSN